MKKYLIGAILATVATFAHADGFDAVLPIHSWHFDGSHMAPQKWNENNFGLGFEYRKDGFFVGALAYHDSYYNIAKTAYVGYTYSYPLENEWSLDATVRAGYIDGSGFHNWGALPSVGVTYKKTSVELEFLPAIKNYQASVLAVMIRQGF